MEPNDALRQAEIKRDLALTAFMEHVLSALAGLTETVVQLAARVARLEDAEQDPADRTPASSTPGITAGGDGKGRIPSHSPCLHQIPAVVREAEAKLARPAWSVLHGGGMLVQPPAGREP